MLRLSIAALLSFTLAAQLNAGTVTNIGGANPAGYLEQHVADNRTAVSNRNGGGERIFGQTFYAPSNTLLNGLAFKTANARDFGSLSPTTLQIKVFDMDPSDPVPPAAEAGTPDSDNVLLGTFDFDVSSLSYGVDEWLKFDFDDTVFLNSGELYGFLVFWDSANADNDIRVRLAVDSGSQIPGVLRRIAGDSYNSANWTGSNPFSGIGPENGSELTFVAFSVPEPHSFVMAAVGLFGVCWATWRRRRVA